MSVQSFKNAGLWIDGSKFDSQIRATTLDYSGEPLDATTIADNTRTRVGGLKNINFTHEGYFEATASSSGIDAAMFAAVGVSNVPVSVAPQNSSEGAVAYLFRSIHTQYEPSANVGELLAYSVQATGDDDLIRGLLLRNSTSVTSANSTGTAFQLGGSSGRVVRAALHVIADDVNGGGSTEALAVILESAASSGFSSPTTRISFAATTGSTSEWASFTAGTTDDWWRATASTPSSSGAYWFVVSAGVSTN